jgi:lipopolysaccharide transport system ATP-binding protein
MSTVVIHGEGLGKRYHRGALQQSTLLRDHLSRILKSPLSVFRRPKDETFWALQDVSLEVRQGEVLGLIGRNGAGKTTLLKILSRITKPTTGWAEIHGRVGSLLEVGTGFHPELTGRENTFLSGAILGMGKTEIKRKFDEIVAFAELEQFIDTPVKHYSSGMYVRLAFAVAAHLEPEILLVDEVLAVGDASFQKKCLGKMGDVSRQGRTIVLVSHNMTAIQTLSHRVMWFEGGSVLQDGPATSVISAYLSHFTRSRTEHFWPEPQSAPGNDVVRIRKVNVRPDTPSQGGKGSDLITVRTPLVMEFEYWNLQPGAHLSLSIHIYDGEGTRAFATFPPYDPLWDSRSFPVGLFSSRCYIPGDLLNAGTYRVHLLVIRDHSVEVFGMEDGFVFEVQDARFDDVRWYGKIPGVVRPALKWNTELIQTSDLEAQLSVFGKSADQRSDG